MDPEKSTFWVQSDVPEVQELTWVLSNFTPMGLLERCHSYKDKIAQGIAANHGLFAYPVLMAADILLFQSERVPVGKDQKQHVEVARDIAIKFNNEYGEIFTLPEPEIDEEVATVPGLDGQKMSKSYGNTIDLFADDNALRKQVMRIVTDPTPVEEPKDPDNCNVYQDLPAVSRQGAGCGPAAALPGRRPGLRRGQAGAVRDGTRLLRPACGKAPGAAGRPGRAAAHPRRGGGQGPPCRSENSAEGPQKDRFGVLRVVTGRRPAIIAACRPVTREVTDDCRTQVVLQLRRPAAGTGRGGNRRG